MPGGNKAQVRVAIGTCSGLAPFNISAVLGNATQFEEYRAKDCDCYADLPDVITNDPVKSTTKPVTSGDTRSSMYRQNSGMLTTDVQADDWGEPLR